MNYPLHYSGDDDKKESLLYRSIDMKTSPYQTEFEKQISILPQSLAFVKKFIYYKFLPYLDKKIDELESIKQTPNYDEKIVTIKQQYFNKVPQITALDSFNIHNIKHMKSNKMCLGTISGSLIIYDLDNNRNIVEKSITQGKRIEIIASSSIRFFDAYLSRIATCSRGDPNINVFSFNHLFPVLNPECVINLYTITNISQPDIPLSCLVHSMKFSSDTFYLSVGDYSGGIRLYRFFDIPPNIKQMDEHKSDTKKDLFGGPFAFNPAKKEEKANAINPSLNKEVKKEENNTNPPFFLVNTFKFKETENFSVVKKEELVVDPKDKKAADKNKPAANNPKNDKGKVAVQSVPTEPIYELKSASDGNCDLTPVMRFPNLFPMITFSQKKIVVDDNGNNNFISYLVTNGLYFSFYGSKNFKYICLYPLINDKMKSLFKVSKNKPVAHASNEDSMSISTSIAKKEKEFINFLKQKIDSLNSNPVANVSSQTTSNFLIEKSKNLEEFSYDLLNSISCMATQKSYQSNNFIGFGMKDGSILVFDTDYQSDKHLFQTLRYEVTQISIDECFLAGCSIDGQVHIYDLISGTVTYQCYNNPYQNYPILSISPIFTLLSLVVDQSQRISVYNMKEKNKICKIMVKNDTDRYKITNYTNLLMDFNQEYIVFVVEKDKSEAKNYTVLDLINFQTKKDKSVMKEFNNIEPFNINYQLNLADKNLETKSSYISLLKIKDLILRCYPQFGLVIKKGLSLKKIMMRYDSQNVLTGDDVRNSYLGKSFLNSLTKNLSKPEKKKNKDTKKKDTSLNSVREKGDEDVKKGPFSIEDGTINIILETVSSEDKKNSFREMSVIQEKNDAENKLDTNVGPQNTRHIEAKYQSSQKKDIFYHAFHNIRERYQYKEQRMQKLQSRYDNIVKELKLPLIGTKSPLQNLYKK